MKIGILLLLAFALTAPVANAAPLDLVGSYDPGSPGFNATAVGLDGVAYLGSWGSTSNCPSLGVRVIDVHDPSAPFALGTAASYRGTTAEHLAAVRMSTAAFGGNVLFVGIQRCAAGGAAPSGLAIWDVTDPANPSELGFVSTARAGRGVHEFTVRQQNGRWYAYLAVPNSEVSTGRGDLRIVDVTDPRQPTEIADWGAGRDAGLAVGTGPQCRPACRGTVAQAFLHSVALSPDARTAYLSYWDQGVILLDVSEPRAPVLLGQFAEPRPSEGNTHSVSVTPDGKLALVGDETGSEPWGALRLVDVQDPANPVQVGVFETPEAAAGLEAKYEYGYSLHNPLADDRDPTLAYMAWYADGVRMLNIADASAPVEIGTWAPPRAPMVWNVSFMGNLLIVGDIDTGLYILRR